MNKVVFTTPRPLSQAAGMRLWEAYARVQTIGPRTYRVITDAPRAEALGGIASIVLEQDRMEVEFVKAYLQPKGQPDE